jgi:hypothetical protein
MLLSEFPQQVINSHALIVAGIMDGETPSADTLLELAAETITVDRLSVLIARHQFDPGRPRLLAGRARMFLC